ncbi:NPR1 [Branchiostoma lanceolatum]|uniref:Guanylate cyclase n=1 Tax=Branchiostoma lanceolatum TaxID=7740 RepID=A0A8J9ZLZ9_BRALA|nr:NPR1 [Branchiostoma lanceolatum]
MFSLATNTCIRLLAVLVCFGDVGAREFRIGLLLPQSDDLVGRMAWETTAGAATLAAETVMLDSSLLPGHTISLVWRDSGCNAVTAAGRTVELYTDEHVDAILCPPCNDACVASALLAGYWKIPAITWAAIDPRMDDKVLFNTLTRLLLPFNSLGKVVAKMFAEWGWTRAVIFSSNMEWLCTQARTSLKTGLRKVNATVVADYRYDSVEDDAMREQLKDIKETGQIICMCHHDKETERRVMLHAHDLGMTNGEFVFINAVTWTLEGQLGEPWRAGDERDEDAKQAYGSVLNGSSYSPFLHDAVILYALVMNKTLQSGEDPRDGEAFMRHARKKAFEGGAAVSDDLLQDLVFIKHIVWGDGTTDAPTGLRECGYMNEQCASEQDKRNDQNEKKTTQLVYGLSGLGVVLILATGIGVYVRKRFTDNKKKDGNWQIKFYDINFTAYDEKEHKKTQSLGKSEKKSFLSAASGGTGGVSGKSETTTRNSSRSSSDQDYGEQDFNEGLLDFNKRESSNLSLGRYEDNLAVVKKIFKQHVSMSRAQLVELKVMKGINNEHLNRFIGVCTERPNICYLFQYCTRGSVRDVLDNDNIEVDDMFQISFIVDIAKGMEYIHQSIIKYHGKLKSTKCVLDQRWVVKITDYGLKEFKFGADVLEEPKEQEAKSMDPSTSKDPSRDGETENRQLLIPRCKGTEMLWTAPEILRNSRSIANYATAPKSDVYSYGIIVHEILTGDMPYSSFGLNPSEVLAKIAGGMRPPFRPMLPSSDKIHPLILRIMQECWTEDPLRRPDFASVRSQLFKELKAGKNTNLMDDIIHKMETYTSKLEKMVEERNDQLMGERMRAEAVLDALLPRPVAEKLKLGEQVPPEFFEQATIFFSDIVGFTKISAASTPFETIDLLNDLYSLLDGILSQHDVYKVETIGDAYMVASGLPQRNGDRHAAEICNMALHIQLAMSQKFVIKHMPGTPLKLRVGVHTGSVAAGVVGTTMPRYCLFGDTVTTANMMESRGAAHRVHISSTTRAALMTMTGYHIEPRGKVELTDDAMSEHNVKRTGGNDVLANRKGRDGDPANGAIVTEAVRSTKPDG